MHKVHCYTSISYSYLDRARVLAETVRKFHPNWRMWVLLSDDPPPGMNIDAGPDIDYVLNVMELGIPEPIKWIFGHDVVELCTAVKGPMMARLLDSNADAVIYLDPDTALFSPLDDVIRMLETHSIVLTPHVVDPELSDGGILDNEIGSLKHGVYNLGFAAVRSCKEGRRFGAWWRDRLLKYCIDDVPNGLFTDQRWCDLVPALFEDVGILRDRGYNVAAWNLSARPIQFDRKGRIWAGDSQLRFFHFTKVNSVGEAVLAHYAQGHTEVFELLRWYRERLTANAVPDLPEKWWKYGYFQDGTPVSREYRRLWRIRGDAREHFANPFAADGNCFKNWARAEGIAV